MNFKIKKDSLMNGFQNIHDTLDKAQFKKRNG